MKAGLLDDDTFPVEEQVNVGETDMVNAVNSRLNLTDQNFQHNSGRSSEFLGAGSPGTQAHAVGDINIMPTAVPMSPGGVARRNFFNRAFGKLEKGGVRNSTFLLCNAAIGGGVLSLPYMFVLSGYFVGYVLLLVSAVAGVWSNLMLAEVAIRHKKTNYDQVVQAAGGKPLQRLLQVMLLIDLFGACTGYQII